jgi:glycosyltransferase involved in cell wall biosynthesis
MVADEGCQVLAGTPGVSKVDPEAPPRARISVVIPAYKVATRILGVVERIGPEVTTVIVVDDACPEGSGSIVESQCKDPRVTVIYREQNGGVGAAVKTGWRAALECGSYVVVKIDGDGQMAPELVSAFVEPILSGRADYTKGNRFYDPEHVRRMPRLRLLGNAALSFLSKASSGYWRVFDPTNGYTAISSTALKLLPLEKIADGYFFESDVLFRLGTIRAVVLDVPMLAVYADEQSSLSVGRVIGPFMLGHFKAFVKRIGYNHFLRGFSVASIELLISLPLLLFGLLYGISTWAGAAAAGTPATSGQVMIAALPIIVGVQLLLAFLQYDVASTPDEPLTRTLGFPASDRAADVGDR